MSYSPYCQYAIQALVFLANPTKSVPSHTRDVADSSGIPPHTLTKVMTELRRANLVRAFMGSGGGFELSRPAVEITCGDVLDALNCHFDLGLHRVDLCLLGFKRCKSDSPCALHKIRQSFQENFKNTMFMVTVDEFSRFIQRVRSESKDNKTNESFSHNFSHIFTSMS